MSKPDVNQEEDSQEETAHPNESVSVGSGGWWVLMGLCKKVSCELACVKSGARKLVDVGLVVVVLDSALSGVS